MKKRTQCMKYGSGAVLVVLASNASAAVSEGVTTAITTAATDGATVAASVLLVFLGIKAVRWLRGAL